MAVGKKTPWIEEANAAVVGTDSATVPAMYAAIAPAKARALVLLRSTAQTTKNSNPTPAIANDPRSTASNHSSDKATLQLATPMAIRVTLARHEPSQAGPVSSAFYQTGAAGSAATHIVMELPCAASIAESSTADR
ncbi:phosphoglucomutase, alpha-D-glucose phosphate-specific [Mycolicibacterium brisbanense]|uniref:Phosphoglucomutase, alpha-D-glucose phosphate-specific n=1 Tax=Mycolicibacterium brisbanense TaxID=146020 RepID=A0A100VVM2_9MYCO|nr:phosphoglucomutase, alpha-D-glucose phosphate-specific [Mycolicibacterium brisbanense]